MTTFIDTSFLLAIVLADDAQHERAMHWQSRISGGLVTTEYVLVEFVDALTQGHLREVAMATLALVRNDSSIDVVPASTELLNAGLTLFASRADKRWGLTDCISFVVMQQRGIAEALTSDHHFEQAGFTGLLRKTP